MKQLSLLPTTTYVVRFTATDNKGNARVSGWHGHDNYRAASLRAYGLICNAFILKDSVTIHAENYWVGHR
jgi:hypothetical protein